MSREHKCPYNGYMVNAEDGPWACGIRGALCHRCREDRADRRAVLRLGIQPKDLYFTSTEDAEIKDNPLMQAWLRWLATGEWPE